MILLISEQDGKKTVHTFDTAADALDGIFKGNPPDGMKIEDIRHMTGGTLIMDVESIRPHWVKTEDRLPEPGQRVRFIRQFGPYAPGQVPKLDLFRGKFEIIGHQHSAFVSDQGMRYWTQSEGVTHWCSDPDPVLP